MRTIFLVALFFALGLAKSQPITFQKMFSGVDQNLGYSVQQTIDGGYIMAGIKDFPSVSLVYIIKTNAYGDTLWTKTFDYGQYASVRQTKDNGYIISSYSSQGILLIKTDSNGEYQWAKVIPGSNINYSVQQTNDSGYVLVGSTTSLGAGSSDVYLIKTDVNGNISWAKTIGSTNSEEGYSVQQTNDGGYIISGYIQSPLSDVLLIKTDESGNVLWIKTYGGSDEDQGYSVRQTNDGGYIILGSTKSFGGGYYDVFLIKTDTIGNFVWARTFDGASDKDEGADIYQTSDGGYILTGYTTTNLIGISSDVFLIKTNSLGDTLWSKVFGGQAEDMGWSVAPTKDNGTVITGYIAVGPNFNVYLIKTDSLGNSGCNELKFSPTITMPSIVQTSIVLQESSGGSANSIVPNLGYGFTVTSLCTTAGMNENFVNNDFFVFPNPFSTQANLILPKEINTMSDAELVVYDIMGNETTRVKITAQRALIERGNLDKGMYFCKVIQKNIVIATGKFIIQ